MMIFYKQRVMVADEYNKWMHDKHVLHCPESLVAFLQIKGWLNEDEIMRYWHTLQDNRIEVVRCKDCKRFRTGDCDQPMGEDGYCSGGERKESEE